ncbi:MAG: cysteine desulfurase [Patescibacteria group bacterium]|jgi:cysteine desulfurase|nr:cysteine desulfurase [Patescibacteria group bacterium]
MANITQKTTKSKKLQKSIYLDYASNTPVDAGVLAIINKASGVYFGNPSALYKEGVLAKEALSHARKDIAKVFDVHSDEIIFCGSGTESNNMALAGVIEGYLLKSEDKTKNPHVIISAIEHSSLIEPVQFLRSTGINVTIVPVDKEGIVGPKSVREALTKDTVFVSVMYANNEIGTIQPISEIAKAIRHFKKTNALTGPYPIFHTDATQAINYLPLRVPPLGVDMLTCNGSKIYGPKGMGMLYKKRGIPFSSMLKGGDQEFGFRPGTENTPGILGFTHALLLAEKIKEKEVKRLTTLRDFLISEVKKEFPGIELNGHETLRLPNNINFTFHGIESDALVIGLDAKGVRVSSKSACKIGDEHASHVIMALSKKNSPEDGSLRITLGRLTEKKDIVYFVRALNEVVDLANQSITILNKSR